MEAEVAKNTFRTAAEVCDRGPQACPEAGHPWALSPMTLTVDKLSTARGTFHVRRLFIPGLFSPWAPPVTASSALRPNQGGGNSDEIERCSKVCQRFRGRDYLSGSSRNSFAVNIKVVVAARAIGIGHEQLHKFCPEEVESWCKHRRAKALGEPAPDHTLLLTKAQGLALLPIYRRLTEEKLLTRCLQGKTQNAAESLNSKIWLLCPKTKFASRTVVETATAIAVLWYNRGHGSFEQVLQELGVLPPEELVVLGSSRNQRRMKKLSARQTAEARAHRRNMVKRARLTDSTREDLEGPMHAPGEF
ncbi:hypothetical protein HPB47_016749 [Ixodes persulcatus]|uniref:Uncharacterized protein n=1 Tax=Ixodes persulcatus TaxID=34615 RepID=A0AC60QQ30_IXOPE|nr:hypothetical protein HPB47_016749 [Ixodes persulcatus]